jgi:hypothetical protein
MEHSPYVYITWCLKALRSYLTLQKTSLGDGNKTSILNTQTRNDNLQMVSFEHLS